MKRVYLLIAIFLGIMPVFAQNESHQGGKQQYTINATAFGGFGTVAGTGVYNEGDTCVLTATANEGHEFVYFYEDSSHAYRENPYVFVVTGDRDLLVVFSTFEYNVNVTVTPAGYGGVTGAKKYKHGQTCCLTAQFYDGYDFEKWTENGVTLSTNPVFRFTVTGERDIKAHFFKRIYTVTASVDPEEGGVVEGGGTFTYGESCVLKTFPREGYDFVGWKINNSALVSTDAIYIFDVTRTANYVACYASRTYQVFVNANPSNGGLVSGSGTYVTNQECTVAAVAADGFRFVAWTEDGDTVSTDDSYAFVVHGNANLVAQFIPNTGVGESVEVVCLFPNPIEAGQTLRVSGGAQQFDALTLCDLFGRTLFEARGDTAGGLTITLPDALAPGCYLVKLTRDNEVVRYGKILVR